MNIVVVCLVLEKVQKGIRVSDREKGASSIALLIIVSLTLAAAGSIVYVSFSDVDEKIGGNAEIGVEVGDKAPNFSLTTLEGENFTLRDHQGQVIIINFMATWCPYCGTEINHLKDFYSDYKEEKVSIISIDIDPRETKNQLSKFKNNHNADWKFAMGPKVGVEYEVSGIPVIYILNGEGIISDKFSGEVPASLLSDKVEELL